MTGVIVALGLVGWAVAAGAILMLVHGGTRDRQDGPKPSLGDDVSEDVEPPAAGI